MTTGVTWLAYRTDIGCASAVYISRDNWWSMLSNITIRDYVATLFSTQDNRWNSVSHFLTEAML